MSVYLQKTMKGLIHIHSKYSDGDLSLPEIKERAQNLGANFVLMADHMEYFKSQKELDEMIEECRKLSGDDFLMVPGFEVSPKRSYHIIVYNGRNFINHDPDFNDLIKLDFTDDQFLVLAHASHYSGKLPKELTEKLDGIEVWNAKYDSKYAPSIKSLRHLAETNLIAMAGLDAHSAEGLEKLWIEAEIGELSVKEIFSAFRNKKFKVVSGRKTIDINKSFGFSQKFYFAFVNFIYFPIRTPLVFFAKLGLNYPKFLKKIFHKFF